MFCQKCGTDVGGAKFCPKCGNPINAQNNVQGRPQTNQPAQPQYYQHPPVQGGVRCPRCGSTNLQAINEVNGKGVSALKLCLCGLFGLCGAGKPKNQQFWVCQNCGNKFKL